MSDELLPYYDAELAYLREAGAEFARKYPKVAARLQLEADKCEDPHVERLLEGVAFLTARIRHKIDDEFPEITDALLGILAPHLRRPLPSLTVVQIEPGGDRSALSKGYTVGRGTRLISPPLGGAPCPFITAYPTTLWPITVASAQLDPDRVVIEGRPAEAVALLRLGLHASGGATFAQMAPERLRFYLDGTGTVPHALYELLLNRTCRVVVRGLVGERRHESLTLPPGSIRPVGFERDEGLFPYSPRMIPGYRLIQEYFALPEKFLFFDVTGMDRMAGRGFGEAVELLFFLSAAPRGDLVVSPENFKLGCTPAVNLFSQVAEPIRLERTKFEYRVVPDVHRPMGLEVYSIESVKSSGYLEEEVPFEPFYSVRHASGEARGPSWYATRRPSPRKDDPGTEVYLSFVDAGFRPQLPGVETLTVRTICTNRDLPAQLPFGGEQGIFEVEGHAPAPRARCLRKPTRPLRPPTGRGAQWRLISQLSLNHLSLADGDAPPGSASEADLFATGSHPALDALREVLLLNEFSGGAAARQQVQGIVGLSSRRTAGRTGRRVGNAVCLGVEVTLEFDEANYVGGSAFLMASVLERFLGLYTTINSFTQLVAKSRQREGILKRWPPRAGDRTLL